MAWHACCCIRRLLLHQLPFNEDLRDRSLPSFDVPKKTPSAEQEAAAANLVDAFMLDTTSDSPLKQQPHSTADAVKAGTVYRLRTSYGLRTVLLSSDLFPFPTLDTALRCFE